MTEDELKSYNEALTKVGELTAKVAQLNEQLEAWQKNSRDWQAHAEQAEGWARYWKAKAEEPDWRWMHGGKP